MSYLLKKLETVSQETLVATIEQNFESLEDLLRDNQNESLSGYTVTEPVKAKPFQQVMVHKTNNWTGVTLTKDVGIFINHIDPISQSLINSGSFRMTWKLMYEY